MMKSATQCLSFLAIACLLGACSSVYRIDNLGGPGKAGVIGLNTLDFRHSAGFSAKVCEVNGKVFSQCKDAINVDAGDHELGVEWRYLGVPYTYEKIQVTLKEGHVYGIPIYLRAIHKQCPQLEELDNRGIARREQ